MMPFHSYEFVLGFLPISYMLFLLAYQLGGWPMAIRALGVVSLVYYSQFGLEPVLVLAISVALNFVLGRALIGFGPEQRSRAGALLVLGVIANLGMLGYFKYSNFFIDTVNQVGGTGFSHLQIILPIGISFFSFIQIGYLIEAYNGEAQRQRQHHVTEYVAVSNV